MKRKVLFCLILIQIIAASLYAGPFGLEKGMTFEEVTEACGGKKPYRIENDDRYYIYPEKSHSRFVKYIAWISEDYGLYAVRGISDDIVTNKYGEELKSAFYAFVPRITKVYGEAEEVFDDLTEHDTYYIWRDNQYWLNAFKDGGRDLYARWMSEDGSPLKDDVYRILLWTSSSGYNNTVLLIDYEFTNIMEVKNQEDEVL